MVTPRDIRLRGATGEMAAQVFGTGDKPTLALHGWLDNSSSFSRLAPLFPELEWVALDLAGHGHSEHRPPGVMYHLIDYVADLHQVAQSLGWQRFQIVSHSLGGAVAALFASVFPERVSRLVLLESLGAFSAQPGDLPKDTRRYLDAFDALSGKELPIYPSIERAAATRQAAGDLTLDSARILSERGLKQVAGGFTWRSDPRLRLPSPQRLTDAQIDGALGKISCPTLLVRALSGLPLIKNSIPTRGAQLRDLTVAEVPGGHHVHLDSPEAVAPAMRDFFQAKA